MHCSMMHTIVYDLWNEEWMAALGFLKDSVESWTQGVTRLYGFIAGPDLIGIHMLTSFPLLQSSFSSNLTRINILNQSCTVDTRKQQLVA